jgi:thiamine biosynthesis lipoprotein
MKISGEAQGTTYSISWISYNGVNYQPSIDSIFKKIDSSLSTYLPASIISLINNNDSAVIPDDHFIIVFKKAQEVSEKTNGAFDITVAPVINAWGFGFTKKANVDSAMIDSLLQFIGYKKVKLDNNNLVTEKKKIMLDFNAIAQGYTVDVLSSFLESKGIQNYFVELGGEVKAKGKKENDEYWKVGIDKPDENTFDERPLQAIINLENRSLATSGNYRKFYEESGQKYSHIIDPGTGYPAKNNLLSASVTADDCMTADAYATAFMVMGLERSKQFLSENKNLKLEVYFIYDEKGVWKTFVTENLRKMMTELN